MLRSRWFWGILLLLLVLAAGWAVMKFAVNQPKQQEEQQQVEEQPDPETAARFAALEENAQILAHLKMYQTMQTFIRETKLPIQLNVSESPHAPARKAVEAAKGDYAAAQLVYIAEREKLLKAHREAIERAPQPEGKARADLAASAEKALKDKDERNLKLSAEVIDLYRQLGEEAKRILDAPNEVPGEKMERILNSFSGVLLEQLLIDLRWQHKQVFLHWFDPVKYPDAAVPTADLLDSRKIRKR